MLRRRHISLSQVMVPACALLLGIVATAAGQRVEIWDNGPPAMWTTTMANGDPIDTGNSAVENHAVAVDPVGKVYAAFQQSDGSVNRIYLNRYNGGRAEIWDRDTSSWTANFADGDPIDRGGVWGAFGPEIASDSAGRIYVVFQQYDGTAMRIYLSRYDGTRVEIWDHDTASWTATLADGDPIDTGNSYDALAPKLAADSGGRVYVTFRQWTATVPRTFLSRYNGTRVEIWDHDAASWTATMADGDPIDTGTDHIVGYPEIAVGTGDRVYVSYRQSDGANDRLYLSRYDGTRVKIWDHDSASWTATMTDGDPIDTGSPYDVGDPKLAADSSGRVYVVFRQWNGTVPHLYLSRYDGTRVEIWDRDTASWTAAMADGDPIDNCTGNVPGFPEVAVDQVGRVYVVYQEDTNSILHLYLSRYNGTRVEIWDHDTASWTATMADGDPIDRGGSYGAFEPQIASDPAGRVYVAFQQFDGTAGHLYLTRYNGANVEIWDSGSASWTTTLADGDPIDLGIAHDVQISRIAANCHSEVYALYTQFSSLPGMQLYVSRSMPSAPIRINFQPPANPTPYGWTGKDTAEPYGTPWPNWGWQP